MRTLGSLYTFTKQDDEVIFCRVNVNRIYPNHILTDRAMELAKGKDVASVRLWEWNDGEASLHIDSPDGYWIRSSPVVDPQDIEDLKELLGELYLGTHPECQKAIAENYEDLPYEEE